MIQAEQLTRTYGDLTAVDAVSFTIDQGEIVGLLGRNGAGKSTIMKMLTGFLEPTGGRVVIDGLDLENHRQEVQSRLGYLPENCPLYPEMTVIEYLDYTAGLHGIDEKDRPGRLREAIDRTELGARATRPISSLSRGYRQRVGVAQAILHRPSILILDEPTNGLDPAQVLQMRQLVRDLARESTVILSTHIMQEVEAVCDRVIIIQDGKKGLDSRLDELQRSRRLLLTTDLAPDRIETGLADLDGTRRVQVLERGQQQYRYGLESDDPAELATAVARLVLARDGRILSLHPETRDLETIFREITTPRGEEQ